MGRPGSRGTIEEQVKTSTGRSGVRFRLSTQLYAGIWAAVALTMAAGLVGWFSFNRVGESQAVVNEQAVPDLEAAFRVAQFSSALVDAAPVMATAASQGELIDAAAGIAATHDAFEDQLASLEENTPGDQYQQLRDHSDSLIDNIGAIYNDKVELFGLAADEEGLRGDVASLRERLGGILNDLLVEADPRRGQDLPDDRIDTFRHLTEIQSNTSLSVQLLATAFSLTDSTQIKPLREQFEMATGRISESLSALGALGGDDLERAISQLSTLGLGTNGVFNLVTRELRLLDCQTGMLRDNRVLAVKMVNEVDILVEGASQRAAEAWGDSDQAILTGRTLLLAIGALCAVSAALWAWLFVGRVILRRLSRLSDRMRGMAKGDLETGVAFEGNDEVAEMAQALEVFRRRSLEAQRLNLVEELADELYEKNKQMEETLADLKRAQDQIVMQGKLAALGELTAGVAHEIRNPLHFVMNFSEASEEMLDELRELVETGKSQIAGDDDQEYALEIVGDLESNLQRILSHSDRANRIVEDMLRMGRDSGERIVTDLNTIVHDHMKLAYHSARALDTDFNTSISEDYDPIVGEMEVVPQDLGRVFLNLVGNACFATDRRRREWETSGREGRFVPEIHLGSHRLADRVVFTVWDNGGGIPPEIIEDIFLPFFTTKPADQGTGLGLSISSDIARQHGGFIRVETEPGESTTMIVELPTGDTPITPTADPEQ